jgi:hypothetical protein
MPGRDRPGLGNGRPLPQPANGGRSVPTEPPKGLIGRQAKEIIDEVLAPGGECDEAVRQGLRRQVAALPGSPAQALLEHVLAIRMGQGPSVNTPPIL